MIDIIYPYNKKKAAWREIEYSIKSIQKYFMDPHRIHIIGEDDLDLPGVDFSIYCEDAPHYTTEQNNGRKLAVCCKLFDEFVWMNDDFYLLKPTTLNHIKSIPPKCNMLDYNIRGKNRWNQLLWRTYDMLKDAGIDPVYNFATHTPQFYHSDNILLLADQFPLFQGEVLLETLYFNWFRPLQLPMGRFLSETEKAGYYFHTQSITQKCLKEKFSTCRYLNHDNAGLTDNLKKMIVAHFKD